MLKDHHNYLPVIDGYVSALPAGRQGLAASGYSSSQFLTVGLDADLTVGSHIGWHQSLQEAVQSQPSPEPYQDPTSAGAQPVPLPPRPVLCIFNHKLEYPEW